MRGCRVRFVACVVALGVSAAFVHAQDSRGAQAQTPDSGAVLTIDGVAVSGDAYGRWMLDLFASRLARDFGEQWLVREVAAARGVQIEPQIVEQRIDSEVAERVANAFLGVREDWLAELRRLEQSEGGYRSARRVEVEPELLATEMCRRERVVPEDKIVRDWELYFGPQGHEYALSGVFIGVAVESPPESGAREVFEARRRDAFAAGRAKALDARERLLGGANFADVARECSEDATSRAAGGRLDGKFRPPGWNDPFVKSVLALQRGAISPPMYAKGGYWVLRVDDLAVTPLESVRAQLTARLLENGPEQDEIGRTWSSLTENMTVQLQPTLFEESALAPESREPVVGMLVNGKPVARATFALWLLHARGEHYARDFSEHFLIEREAGRLGVTATDAEVDARLAEFRQAMLDDAHHGNRERWLEYLRLRGRDESTWEREWRRRMRIDVLTEKLVIAERRIDEAQIRARWQELYGAEGRCLEVRWIVIPFATPKFSDGMTREEVERAVAAAHDASRVFAERVAARLDDGEDFASLARSYSSDEASRARGGTLEGRFRPEQWSPELARAVSALEVGAHSPALETGKGFAIFEALAVRPVSFESARAELERELRNARVPRGDLAGYRNLLFQRSKVEVRPSMYE